MVGEKPSTPKIRKARESGLVRITVARVSGTTNPCRSNFGTSGTLFTTSPFLEEPFSPEEQDKSRAQATIAQTTADPAFAWGEGSALSPIPAATTTSEGPLAASAAACEVLPADISAQMHQESFIQQEQKLWKALE